MKSQHLLALGVLFGAVACSAEAPAPVAEEAVETVTEEAALPGSPRYSFQRVESAAGEPADVLVVDAEGAARKIQAFDYSMGAVAIEQDLNGDGTVDAIVSVHGGGNCCPADYYFVADMGAGEFSVTQIPEVYAWQDPVAEEAEGRAAVRFVSVNEGMNTDDYLETTHVFRFEGAAPVIVSKSVKEEMPALAEIRSSAVGEDDNRRISFAYDLNGDGREDEVSCGLWERWGRLADCHVSLQDDAEPVVIDAACKRLGVVSQASDGMQQLVCDADSLIAFDPVSGQYGGD